MTEPAFPLTKLTFLAFQINGIIDDTQGDGMTLAAMKARADAGTVFELLDGSKRLDVSIFDQKERAFLSEQFMDLTGVQERRKYMVENNGWCLLMAYILEIMQITRAR